MSEHVCLHVSTCVHLRVCLHWKRARSCLIRLDSSLISKIFRGRFQQPQTLLRCHIPQTHPISLPLFASSLAFGRVSPCRQVHAPVAAKVPTCPPYARLRSASLLLPLPTRIQLAGPPQICSHSPPPVLHHTHQYPSRAFILPHTHP